MGILKEFYRTEVSSDCTPWLVKLSSWVMRADIRVNESKNAKGETQDGVLPEQEAKGEKKGKGETWNKRGGGPREKREREKGRRHVK